MVMPSICRFLQWGHWAFGSSTTIPLAMQLERILQSEDSGGRNSRQHSLLGMPSTPDDLVRLVEQYEEKSVQNQLRSALPSVLEPLGCSKHEDEAEKVFAMLRQATKDLESQVAHLESQVKQMAIAKNHGQQEYRVAQLELDRVAKEADRALLSLATASTAELPRPPPMPMLHEGKVSATPAAIACRDGDELLPPLPSDEKLRVLGCSLESKAFAVLNGFLGPSLSSSVQRDLEKMYLESRCKSPDSDTDATVSATRTGSFKLGELAGGNTGRNLRYKMEHVRGDYMLWADEHDAFSPE